jgi:predicted CXXCH cytochrome family protein
MMRHAPSYYGGQFLILSLLCMAGCAQAVATPVFVLKTETSGLPASKQDCTTCHGTHRMDKGTQLLKRPVADHCIECHPERMTPAEHRVGVIPSMNTGTLPLAGNKITCITCHDPHSNRYGRMLRVPAQDLCITCHIK